MINDIIDKIMSEIPTILKTSLSFFLGIFITPLRKFIHSDYKEYCAFDSHLTLQDRKEHKHENMRDVTITKRFGKITKINCPNYRRKNIEIKKINGKKHLICSFGIYSDDDINVKKCPFYK